MYRTMVKGKEIIITLSPKLRKEVTNRDALYEAILTVTERVLQTKQVTFAVNNEEFGLIIGEVQHEKVTVFAVEHIIPRDNIFGDRSFSAVTDENLPHINEQ
ncbi:cytoplasmic protein [Bacillus manliponensis]|uniref:cytoplasmic protein n=1 Tax=Bacillus manliponensis TaxID=574376 RepID=UPI0035184644